MYGKNQNRKKDQEQENSIKRLFIHRYFVVRHAYCSEQSTSANFRYHARRSPIVETHAHPHPQISRMEIGGTLSL